MKKILFAVSILAVSVASAQTPEQKPEIPCVPKHAETALWLAMEYLEPDAPENLLSNEDRAERPAHMQLIRSVKEACEDAESLEEPTRVRVDCSPESASFALWIAMEYLEPDTTGDHPLSKLDIETRRLSMKYIRDIRKACAANSPRNKRKWMSDKKKAFAPSPTD